MAVKKGNKNEIDSRYQLYGSKVSAPDIMAFVKSNIELNAEADESGKGKKSVTCIWGHPGIGKTQLIKDLASEEDYAVVDIPIAQFEELGDFHGLPMFRDSEDIEGKVTKTAPPDWVAKVMRYAKEGKKTIVLFDDFNRADVRILKGIMQLLQDYKMISWELPKGSSIVLTANPDGGDHMVSTLDAAQLTRMKHITMTADIKAWAYWAERTGVDSRGMNFLLRYPEQLVTGDMTNPRSWVEAFKYLKKVPDLIQESTEFKMVEMHVRSCIDEDAATQFLAFLFRGLDEIVEPEEILEHLEDKKVKEKIEKYIKASPQRVDILSVICERLFCRVANPDFKPEKEKKEKYGKNLRTFLKMELPKDLRYSVIQRICHDKTYGKNSAYELLLKDNELMKMVMDVL